MGNKLSVYRHNESPNPSLINSDDAILYFSDLFDLNMFKLADYNKDEIIEFIDEQNQLNPISSKPKLIIQLSGVKFENNPAFEIENSQDFWVKFNKLTKAPRITPEITAISSNFDELKSHFKYFDTSIERIWNNFKQNIFSNDVNYINDKIFINEMSQLIHLNEHLFDKSDTIFINLSCLESLSNKVGIESSTFEASKSLLNDLLKLSQFDIILLDNAPTSNLSKRDDQLKLVFRDNAKGGCFDSEESCQVSTSNCNSHGLCSKSKGCWSCVCSATFNETSSKTTNWSGFDCGKKDISTTANLLLWSSLTILIMFIGGVKLLVSIGDEPLPAVLDAST